MTTTTIRNRDVITSRRAWQVASVCSISKQAFTERIISPQTGWDWLWNEHYGKLTTTDERS